jgi:hypothetical protein
MWREGGLGGMYGFYAWWWWWCESTTILFCIVLYLRCDVLTVHTMGDIV